ncbi:DUF4879 domain-containing protein [Helicobacter sp. MIT 11-5569]|uniref:DUF4879 domain-containing protein n=1 Tax=Helicobacter sp. MIT 11-5569 TaxID=1548151 RepID=UPI00051FCEE0|nr:DUF4879 domain-containing protein [Helicobacter sp. MIT 11-5569]TLD84577.1 DUF4879 domain-containing protein [Helicobacter sp. MIT 11-5569]
MTKKFFSLALASVLSCGIAFGAEGYTTEGKEKVTRNGMSFYVESNSPNKEKILNGEFDNMLETIKKNNGEDKQDKITKAAAPAVSKVYILSVCSSDVGYCEDINEGQTSTNLNHGGNPFFVWTQVNGYGGSNTDSATFSGNQASMLDCIGIEGDNRVIIGWLEQWDITKPANTNGTFTYTARSINVGPTMSTSIYIK